MPGRAPTDTSAASTEDPMPDPVVAAPTAMASMEERLIFLVGPPRSGSTLLMRILNATEQIYSRPQPHLLTPLAHLHLQPTHLPFSAIYYKLYFLISFYSFT